MRIVSCVPSLSEWVAFLNPETLVGRTRYCIYPKELENVTVVGGTKKLVFSRVQTLRPDLILSVKEENDKNQIEYLSQNYKVLTFDIIDLKSAFDALDVIGEVLNPAKSKKEIGRIEDAFSEGNYGRIKALYLIWKNPWMSVGSGTFIHAMMEWAGFHNCMGDKSRYPILDPETLSGLQPDVVFLPDEPYAFDEACMLELAAIFPQAKVLLVDGSLFSWYSQRMGRFPAYAKALREKLGQ